LSLCICHKIGQHHTAQEFQAHWLKNFTQGFDCQRIGHEGKLQAGIVTFVGAADDTLYSLKLKAVKFNAIPVHKWKNRGML